MSTALNLTSAEQNPALAEATARAAAATATAAARRRFARIVIAVMVGLVILFVAGYMQRLSEKAAIEAQIVALQTQIEQANLRTALLTKELQTATDDVHVAAIARDSLGLVQQNDQLLVLIDAPAAPAPAPPPADAPRRPVAAQPNWQRWLDLLLPDWF